MVCRKVPPGAQVWEKCPESLVYVKWTGSRLRHGPPLSPGNRVLQERHFYEKPVPSPDIMSRSRLPAGVTTAQDLVQQPKAEWRERLRFPTPPVTGSNIFFTLKPA